MWVQRPGQAVEKSRPRQTLKTLYRSGLEVAGLAVEKE